MTGDDLERLGEMMASISPSVRTMRGEMALAFAARIKAAVGGVPFAEAAACISEMGLGRRTGDRLPQPQDFVDRLSELSRRADSPAGAAGSGSAATTWRWDAGLRRKLSAMHPSATSDMGPVGWLRALIRAAGWGEADVARAVSAIEAAVPVASVSGWRHQHYERLNRAVRLAVRERGGDPEGVLKQWKQDSTGSLRY